MSVLAVGRPLLGAPTAVAVVFLDCLDIFERRVSIKLVYQWNREAGEGMEFKDKGCQYHHWAKNAPFIGHGGLHKLVAPGHAWDTNNGFFVPIIFGQSGTVAYTCSDHLQFVR